MVLEYRLHEENRHKLEIMDALKYVRDRIVPKLNNSDTFNITIEITKVE